MPISCGSRLLLLVLVFSNACISPRLARLENLDVRLPASQPSENWQAEIAALLDHYERAPVLAPEDDRLEPLFGGLTTLSYFGADAAPRVRDQELLPSGPARAGSLADACTAPGPPLGAPFAAATNNDLPAFVPVWVPLGSAGGDVPATAGCDERGQPTGAERAEVFCAFARLALQPEPGRTLIVVVHGLFDSGAQDYVQRTAAVFHRQGHSVLIPDMRDHGDTLRAAPRIATTLGTLEGPDLLALVQAARQACGSRIGRAGVAGVSGGGLAAMRALTLDRSGRLDAGVLAVSPLLDVEAALTDLAETGACPVTRSIELNVLDTLMLTAASGAAFFGGAALGQALSGRPLDGNTALVAGIGAGAGLLAGLAVDAWFDGGTEPCVSEHAIARLVEDAVRVRWRNLRAPALGLTMSPAGRGRQLAAVTIRTYVRERAEFLASRDGVRVGSFNAVSLARELRTALEARRPSDARLLVIGAEDDPLTRRVALDDFVQRARGIPEVYARAVQHGGHGGMWLVQPTIMQRVSERFFAER